MVRGRADQNRHKPFIFTHCCFQEIAFPLLNSSSLIQQAKGVYEMLDRIIILEFEVLQHI